MFRSLKLRSALAFAILASLSEQVGAQIAVQFPWENAAVSTITKACGRIWLHTTSGVLNAGPLILVDGSAFGTVPNAKVSVSHIEEIAGQCWILTTRRHSTAGGYSVVPSRAYLFSGGSAEQFGEINVGWIKEIGGRVWLKSSRSFEPGLLYRLENNHAKPVAHDLGSTILSVTHKAGKFWLLTGTEADRLRTKPGRAYTLDGDRPEPIGPEDFYASAIEDLKGEVILLGHDPQGAGVVRAAVPGQKPTQLPAKSIQWAKKTKSGLLISGLGKDDNQILFLLSEFSTQYKVVRTLETQTNLHAMDDKEFLVSQGRGPIYSLNDGNPKPLLPADVAATSHLHKAGGRIWIITRTEDAQGKESPQPGRLYLLEGDEAKAFGPASLRVERIFEADGKIWLVDHDGAVFQVIADHPEPIPELPKGIGEVSQAGGCLWFSASLEETASGARWCRGSERPVNFSQHSAQGGRGNGGRRQSLASHPGGRSRGN